MTVYADILFLINFSMDFLSLCSAGRLTSHPLSRRRLLAASAVGSFLGTAMMLLTSPLSEGIPFLIAGFFTAVLMTRLAFGPYRKVLPMLRDSLILWGTGTLLGGIMTSVLSLGTPVFVSSDGSDRFLPVFLLCFALSSVFLRLTRHTSAKTSAVISVTAGGIPVSFEALCDSGCFLTEPISGLPVILGSADALSPLTELLNEENPKLRLRMIPADGVCGHCLLRGFVPDSVCVNGRVVSAVIACGGDTGYGGYDGIVPTRLVR